MNNLINDAIYAHFPEPLLQFFTTMCKPVTYYEESYLNPYEMEFIDFDDFGATKPLNQRRKVAFIGFFIFEKVLI